MRMDELFAYALVGIREYIVLINSAKIGGISVGVFFVFFSLLGMVLVIVFRVEFGDLFDQVRGSLSDKYNGSRRRK